MHIPVITDLIDKGVLMAASDGGRSTNYLLKDDEKESLSKYQAFKS